MSAWKQFLASDIIVNPFVVNKGFNFPSSQFATGSDGQLVGIDRFLGINENWYTNKSTTGTLNTEYQALIYSSAQQLYYSNFLSSSTGDLAARPQLIPGSDPSGDVYVGKVESPIYDNFLQSTLLPNRNFPISQSSTIGVISIPSKIYGDYIQPHSILITTASLIVVDDGEGNLKIANNDEHVGNVIYTHGLLIFTHTGSELGGYGISPSAYSQAFYGGDPGFTTEGIITSSINLSFSSSMTIYETQYKCTIRESEFNATLNPSAQTGGNTITISGSTFYQRGDGNLANNVTGSYFSPYVTTVGLYDELQNLLAVGKLAQPLPTSATTDTTILVNLDR